MNINNVDELCGYIINKVKEIYPNLSDYESDLVRSAIMINYKTIPMNKALISDMLQSATLAKSSLNYLVYKLRDSKISDNKESATEYNKIYTILVRQGRPSKQAIDAEIRFSYPNLGAYLDKLMMYDNLIDLLVQFQDIVNLTIRNLESVRYSLN